MGYTKAAQLVASSSQGFTHASNAALNPTATNISVMAWVKWNSLPTGGSPVMPILGKYGSGSDRSFVLFLLNNSGTLQLDFAIGAGGDTLVNFTPTLGVWYQIVATYNSATGHTNFYVNGVQQGTQQTTPNTGGPQGGGANFDIGYYDSSGSFFMDGVISQVGLFNVELSAATVAAYYCYLFTGSETGLLGLWTLNNTLADLTANANTLSNTNGATFISDIPACLNPATPVSGFFLFMR